ncbi:ADP-forming succinate--CoA ligase subunit beta [Candidatus Bathyarchaeota archaeon]|nr:MAG: ADP-forming succinate--CoA ligase subunit beta [Candidatus Bathyarchaeota archaeon]
MRLLEHQAKEVFARYGIPVPKGRVARTPHEAFEIALELGTPVAVKAQVLVGARGRAGGVLFADTPEDAEEAASRLLGSEVRGIRVHRVLVEEKVPIEHELYLGFTVDRASRSYVAIASPEGGVEIEEVAEKSPELIFKHHIDPLMGFRRYHALSLIKMMGYGGKKAAELTDIFMSLYRLAMDYDAELTEINPLAETSDGRFVAVDARLIIDDNALFRHPDILGLERPPTEEGAREKMAREAGLGYVELDGDIGIIGNGAGLVMATLDMVALYGGRPANFLDVGGGASADRMAKALEVVLSNPRVKVVFINILGGITRCDEIARGITSAVGKLGVEKPLVIRLVGTKEEEGRSILEEAGFEVMKSMEEAAKRAVELAGRPSGR